MPPPPPPPPGPPPPPQPLFAAANSSGGDGRNQLLSSIRQGAKLKKTVTVDKSAPFVQGKAQGGASSPAVPNGTLRNNGSVSNGAAAPALGGLFAGGMPKLRSTGRLGGESTVDSSRTPPTSHRTSPEKAKQVSSNVSQLSAVLASTIGAKYGLGANEPAAGIPVKKNLPEVRNRGPPPQPPVQKPIMTLSSSDSVLAAPSASNGTADGGRSPEASPGAVRGNRSALYGGGGGGLAAAGQRLGGSTSSLGAAAAPPTLAPASLRASALGLAQEPPARGPSHGKPHLAPKPPPAQPPPEDAPAKPSPPPKKLLLNGKPAARAQSMRVPRSPTVTPPCPPGGDGSPISAVPFISLRPGAFNQAKEAFSQGAGTRSNAPHPPSHFGTMRVTRAPLRPPAQSPPPPPARAGSLAAPPPPPPAGAAPPPPPPHRAPPPQPWGGNGTGGGPGGGPGGGAGAGAPGPQPPLRGSSMRPADLELRYGDLFRRAAAFPSPDPFAGLPKGYSSRNLLNANKQQAPQPPESYVRVASKLRSTNASSC